MNEQAMKIQMVMNTIETLDIKANYETMNKLMGCLTALAGVRDELSKPKEEKTDNGGGE